MGLLRRLLPILIFLEYFIDDSMTYKFVDSLAPTSPHCLWSEIKSSSESIHDLKSAFSGIFR